MSLQKVSVWFSQTSKSKIMIRHHNKTSIAILKLLSALNDNRNERGSNEMNEYGCDSHRIEQISVKMGGTDALINEWNAFPEDLWRNLAQRSKSWGLDNKLWCRFRMFGAITRKHISPGVGGLGMEAKTSAGLSPEPEAAHYSFCKTALFCVNLQRRPFCQRGLFVHETLAEGGFRRRDFSTVARSLLVWDSCADPGKILAGFYDRLCEGVCSLSDYSMKTDLQSQKTPTFYWCHQAARSSMAQNWTHPRSELELIRIFFFPLH